MLTTNRSQKMAGKLTTVDDFLKTNPRNFKSKEDVLAWALRGHAKIVVTDGTQSDESIWHSYNRWMYEPPSEVPPVVKDFYIFKITQEEFEKKENEKDEKNYIDKILDTLEQGFPVVHLDDANFRARDSYLRSRIIDKVRKLPKLDSFSIGRVYEKDKGPLKALMSDPPKGLNYISVEGWDLWDVGGPVNSGTGDEDQEIERVLGEIQRNADPDKKPILRVYSHNRELKPKQPAHKLQDSFKKLSNQTESRTKGKDESR